MIFNINMKIADLLENDQALSVFDKFLPGMKDRALQNPQAMQLSIDQLIKYSRIPEADNLLKMLNAELDKLNTPENMISPSEAKAIEFFKKVMEEEKNRTQGDSKDAHIQNSIYPGKVWLDTDGKRIQAHGGAVIYEDGIYYWYGENKEYTDGKNGIWTWGLKVYSSKDLMNWKDLGYLIPPVIDNPNSALFPAKRVDRPHILKCPKTGKYVCWIKLSGAEAAFTIWEADSLLGKYEMRANLYNPGEYKAGDFDLVSDPETGKGYIFFDADHESMMCMELSEDYLKAEREVCNNYSGLKPPFTREAPALFEKNGRKYMLTSGMTGYVPNKSDSAVSDSYDTIFESIGNPHVDDETDASFNSQISKIFRVEGTDMFIAMADRWLPDTKVDKRLADIFVRVIGSNYEPDKYTATEDEKKEMYITNKLDKADTSIADYVWLPIEWEDEKPVIRWKDEW
ncbi:MAG: family 43 glycosylhydrolase, partial [Butyrivibrio sp.]|nr:family 43 glycosylhydrolase [Butyrivibrio sp.]